MLTQEAYQIEDSDPLDILLRGVDVWNRWRETNQIIHPNLRGVKLEKFNLEGVNFSGIDLSSANLIGANLFGADLSGANLTDANLMWAKLDEANLENADLSRAYLIRADLKHANLLAAYLRGAELTEANFYRASLRFADLIGAFVHGASFRQADLRRADLSGGDFTGVDFTRANLVSANLMGSNLRDSTLTDTRLHDANLVGAGLKAAELTKLTLGQTNLLGTDLEALSPEILSRIASRTEENRSTLIFRIQEENLTSTKLALFLTSLSELHTKLWLLKERRFSDFVNFAQDISVDLPLESELIISGIRKNSPTEIKVDMGSETVKALVAGIESISTLSEKRRELKVQTDIIKRKSDDDHDVHSQALSTKEQEAEIDLQRRRIASSREALQRDAEELELQEKRFEIRLRMLNRAIQEATVIVDLQSPGLDVGARQMSINIVAQSILKLAQGPDIEIILALPLAAST